MTDWERFNSTCVICQEVNGGVLHRVKEEWAALLTQVSGIPVKAQGLVCCQHFNPHTTAPGHRFRKSNFPGIKLEFATPTFTRSNKRIRDSVEEALTPVGFYEDGLLYTI